MANGSERAAHLSMIQGVITRMASNSFQLKTLGVTVTAAIVAYLGAVESASVVVVVGGLVAVLIFWTLDARYLRLERLYRKLYDAVRAGAAGHGDYSMSVADFQHEVPATIRIAGTWSVLWIYAALMLLLIAVAITRPSHPPQEPAHPAAASKP
jgi:hypothetical protein